jgi:FKBP-type peptidyl-prolyl cis-trans isomerase
VILLAAFATIGGVYLVFSNKTAIKQTASLPTPTIFARVEPTKEPVINGNSNKITTMENGLQVQDEVVGTGAEAMGGKKVTVNYTGRLTDGTVFDSSLKPGRTPFEFNLGAGEVIKGWDLGVVGMKVGGKRKLTIPSSLAYGDGGIPGVIPGGATLIFDIELLKVE